MPVLSFIIATLALTVSATTAWLTLFRRGEVRMTTPTTIFFGPDGGTREDDAKLPKIYLRTLLFSTAKRGRIVESMYARLRRGESTQSFNIWVYGDTSLARGSGMFVGENGVVCNHHFMPPADGTVFEFKSGSYVLEVFAFILGNTVSKSLFRVELVVTPEQAAKLLESDNGLYFDWGSDTRSYHAHVRPRPKSSLPRWLEEVAG